MFRFRTVPIFILLSGYLILCGNAGYTSDETDEKSKSLYSAVTSILGSTDTSQHHHKHTYDSPPPPPCQSAGRCPTTMPVYISGGQTAPMAPPPCANPNGCPVLQGSAYGNGIAAAPPPNSMPIRGPPSQGGYAGGAQGAYGSYGTYGSYPQPSGTPQSGSASPPGYGYHGQSGGTYGPVAPAVPSQTSAGGYGYQQPAGNWNGNPGYNYGYQGERGYSVLDHSLRTNSEYKEVGTHTGPLQQANNGYGYGSGYGGYMGMYNRPGF